MYTSVHVSTCFYLVVIIISYVILTEVHPYVQNNKCENAYCGEYGTPEGTFSFISYRVRTSY